MLNEPLGWSSIVVGLASGAALGLGYDRPGWLGGYDHLRRRLVRLGHIAMIALGMVNIQFALSIDRMHLSTSAASRASWLLAIGCVTMPACCFINAWRPTFKPLFAIPVATLVWGCVIVIWGLIAS